MGKVIIKNSCAFILIINAILLYNGCNTLHSIGTTMKIFRSEKDSLFDEIKYLATAEEEEEYDTLESEDEINNFMVNFWEKRDPSPGTKVNEIKDEYFKRKEIADKRFKGFKKGSMTDRGRVLILYGEPMTIEYYNSGNMFLGSSKVYSLELWLYNKVSGSHERSNYFSHIYQGRMKFVFADLHGYGIYDQIYSSEKDEFIDSRVYLFRGN